MTALRVSGGTAVIAGVIALAWLAWQLWGASLATQDAQQEASGALAVQWQAPPTAGTPAVGQPIARLRISSIGVDQVVVEGAGDTQLADGPGHYLGTSLPGQPGNVGIAGHRVTHGAPFGRLDELHSCDAIEVEDRDTVWTYRVLPVAGDETPCALKPVRPGREIVTPDRGDVLDPTGNHKLLTLTTCHPHYSARQRLAIHAELVEARSKV